MSGTGGGGGGVADSGTDAGPADAGIDGGLDGGTNDSGTNDAGPEVCDGIDNDHDGTVDLLPDGGPLTAACPLTLGVCAGKVSLCVDGGWAACNYGPDYQATERNCDGLDNDCDGRVDRSAKHVLFGVDAGLGNGGTIESRRTQLLVRDGGFRLAFANEVIDLNAELTPLELQRPVPVHYGNVPVLLADGPNWLRLQTYLDVVQGPFCITADRFSSDGGSDLGDGGPDVLANVCWSNYTAGIDSSVTVPEADGWAIAAVNLNTPTYLVWGELVSDGGFTYGSYDGGPFGNGYPTVYGDEATEQFLVWQYGADPLQVFSFVPSGVPQLSLSVPNPTGYCFATVNPIGYACGSIAAQSWFFADGGALAPTFDGLILMDNHGTPPLAGISFDGGDPSASFTLSELVDGGLVPYAEYDNQPIQWDFKVTGLGGHLQLVLWGEHQLNGTCPNCTIEAYSAEYVCAP